MMVLKTLLNETFFLLMRFKKRGAICLNKMDLDGFISETGAGRHVLISNL
jgi:hypothetical protein